MGHAHSEFRSGIMCAMVAKRTGTFFAERVNPWQKSNKFNSSRHLQLRSLQFVGFMAIKKHAQFVRGVMDYAPNLETIVLQDKDPPANHVMQSIERSFRCLKNCSPMHVFPACAGHGEGHQCSRYQQANTTRTRYSISLGI